MSADGPPGGPPGGPPAPTIDVDEQRATDFASLFRLDGRRAILVGGYGGIGEVTSRLLADYGAEVAIAGRNEDKAKALAQEISSDGGKAIGLRVDLADRESARALVASCVDELGGVDVLVNLAGIDNEAPAEDFDEDEFRQVVEINLNGAFWLSQAAGQVDDRAGARRADHPLLDDAGDGGRTQGVRRLRVQQGRPERPDSPARHRVGEIPDRGHAAWLPASSRPTSWRARCSRSGS